MNFVASSLIFHCDEWVAFWLMVHIFDLLKMKDIYLPSIFFVLLMNKKGLNQTVFILRLATVKKEQLNLNPVVKICLVVMLIISKNTAYIYTYKRCFNIFLFSCFGWRPLQLQIRLTQQLRYFIPFFVYMIQNV